MSEVKMTVDQKIEAVHTNVLAALKAAGAEVETHEAKLKPYGSDETVQRIHKVNGEYVLVIVEEQRSSSRWSSRGTGKVRLTVSCGYGKGCSTGFPEGKDGFPNAVKAAAKLIELVAARKARDESNKRGEQRKQDAKEVRKELVKDYAGVEADYDSSWSHCLTGGPESFRLELHGLTAEQVTAVLGFAVMQGIVKLKGCGSDEA